MSLFMFLQNNSGGGYIRNEKLTVGTIVEAASADEADRRAADLGIYFGGVSLGIDCDCCGDRWEPAGEPLTREEIDADYDWVTEKVIHYADGRMERIGVAE